MHNFLSQSFSKKTKSAEMWRAFLSAVVTGWGLWFDTSYERAFTCSYFVGVVGGQLVAVGCLLPLLLLLLLLSLVNNKGEISPSASAQDVSINQPHWVDRSDRMAGLGLLQEGA